MIFNRLHPIFRRFMAPETGGESGGGGGTVDRGDDWTPTDDDAAALKASADKAEADKVTAAAKKEETEKAEAEKAVTDKAAAEKAAAEGKGEGEGEKDDKKDSKKDTRIPLSRHEEILKKERERRETVERELAATRKGEVVAKTNEDIAKAEANVVVMEKEYLKLLADGKVDDAAAKMAEIRRTERSIVQTQAQFETQAAEARAYERVKYTTVERLEAAFPVINPDHEDFDKEKTGDVLELMGGYVATGKYSRADALQKACKVLLKPATAKQEAATDVDVRVDKEDLAKATAEERKKAAVAKALETNGKQPPNAAHVGADSDKTGGPLKSADVIRMGQEEFKKLDDKALAKLRGDDL
jgi:hypothetical protein